MFISTGNRSELSIGVFWSFANIYVEAQFSNEPVWYNKSTLVL